MDSSPFFYGGVSPKTCVIIPKKFSFFFNFFVKIEKFLQKMDSPPSFYGGMSPKSKFELRSDQPRPILGSGSSNMLEFFDFEKKFFKNFACRD